MPKVVSGSLKICENKLISNTMNTNFIIFQSSINIHDDSNPNHWDIGLYMSGLDFYAKRGGSKVTMGLGMISHKKSLITIFGHKHKIKNFIKNFDIFHEKISTTILVHIWYQILKQNCLKNEG